MKRIADLIKKYNLVATIAIALTFGFGAGLVGEIFARAYLADSWSGLLPYSDLYFSDGKYIDQGLIISNAKNVIVQQDEKVDETINSAAGSLVGIYKKLPAGPAGERISVAANGVFDLANFYKINEPIGQGFIITSDGWIVSDQALEKVFSDYVVITSDKKIYPIDRVVADNLTGFNFIHVQARDLPVKKFTENQEIKRGSLAVAVNYLGLSLVSSVAGFSQPAGLIKSSDSFSEKLVLNDKPAAEFRGSIILNLAGEAIGLVGGNREIEPISHIKGAINSLFKKTAGVRVIMGVNYINLAELAEAGGGNGDWQKGVIIHKGEKTPAVKKNSPADKAGLREGDIIISIDNIDLDKDNNLANIIQDHAAGEAVNLLVSRNGLEKEVKLTLEEAK